MSEGQAELEMQRAAHVPRLLVELPSRPRVFFRNLFDLIFPRRLPQLELLSAPAPFWPDVFVKRGLPWGRFVESCAFHVVAFGLLVGLTRFFALQPQVMPTPIFDHAEVVSYQPEEYLPPLDTGAAPAAEPQKADPEIAPQPIISVPQEADNRSQTIVTPPSVKLKRDVAMLNIVAWSEKAEKPQLEIPPLPLTPAAEISRIGPQMENAVVTPPPDATHLAHRRDAVTLQESVLAPPPDLRASNAGAAFSAPQPALVAPPPSFDAAATRPLGEMNIGHSEVIAPAPKLPVGEQRAVPRGLPSGVSGVAQVIAPPPSVAASGSSGESFGGRGRVIALNLHPAVSAPPDPPAGNRRGAFAATPEGHAGASGSPGSASAKSGGSGNGIGSNRRMTGDLPSGLYVGKASANPSAVAGDPANKGSAASVNPNLMASVRQPRVNSVGSMQPEGAPKLTEAERTVFGNRRFYSLTLNMPNLNSAGGSWVIRFAELGKESSKHDENAPAAELSQPAATRKVDPAYPAQLMRENVAGTVILYAIIHADGTVGSVRVLRGVDDRIDRFASQAVAQWRFHPAMKDGAPVDVEATFLIPFRPGQVGSNF